MFEKEAKRRAKDFTENKGKQVAYECGFLDGAGRMKEEMQKQGLALQSDMDKTIMQNFALKKQISGPKEKKLKVSDLKLGDIVRHKSGNLEYLITGIDHSENEVFFCDAWSDDEELGNWWEKVEK